MLKSNLVAYYPPVNPALFTILYVTLLALGLATMAYFFVYQATTAANKKSLVLELSVAATSSVCLGFGTLFLFLWGGLWV